MTSKPIIAGTDGSGDSLRAVEWAAREAALRRASLQIVCVPALPPQMSWHQPPGRPDAVAEVVRESYACALAAAMERASELEPELAIETRMLFGPPARTLTETTVDASMLVVGARGAGLFTALVLGSASRYAATHGRCPVVVERQGPADSHREIVVGVGELDQSDAALGFAFEEADLRGARLVVMHAWSCFVPAAAEPGSHLAGPERAVTHSGHQLYHGMAARLEDMLAGWREKYPAVETGTEIMHAHPGHLLAQASARADLVVLGRQPGHTGGSGADSVIHTVLHHARGPVAVVAD
jgi:nucleotide-binding universal stress UspA family protein